MTDAAAPGPWTVLRSAHRESWKGLVATTLMVSVHQVCEAATPVVVGLAVDRALDGGGLGGVVMWIGVLAGLYLLLSAAGNGAMPVAGAAATRTEHAVRMDVVGRSLDPVPGVDSRAAAGTTLSLSSSDASRIGWSVDAVASFVSGLVALAVAAVLLFITSPALGLVVLGGTALVVVVAPILGRPLQRRNATQQAAVADSSAVAVDLIRGLRVLHGIGARPAAAERYRRTSRTAMRARISVTRAGAAFDIYTGVIGALLITAVAATGATLAVRGDISIGDLVAGLGLAQFLLGPLERVAGFGASYAEIVASARRVAELGAHEPGRATLARATPLADGALAVRALHTPHLSGVDLTVAPGELVGVVAAEPGAAADLRAVLAGVRRPESGSVRLGEVDVLAGDLRGVLVVVPHRVDLFEDSPAELFGESDPLEVLHAVGADEVASGVAAHGTTSRGRDLSGGQRQRVALGRAVATRAPWLVLDEPTSAVDVATEARVAAGLRRARSGSGTVVLTSSPGLLAVTDRVVLVVEGRVVAEGTHEQLLGRADYAELVRS